MKICSKSKLENCCIFWTTNSQYTLLDKFNYKDAQSFSQWPKQISICTNCRGSAPGQPNQLQHLKSNQMSRRSDHPDPWHPATICIYELQSRPQTYHPPHTFIKAPVVPKPDATRRCFWSTKNFLTPVLNHEQILWSINNSTKSLLDTEECCKEQIQNLYVIEEIWILNHSGLGWFSSSLHCLNQIN